MSYPTSKVEIKVYSSQAKNVLKRNYSRFYIAINSLAYRFSGNPATEEKSEEMLTKAATKLKNLNGVLSRLIAKMQDETAEAGISVCDYDEEDSLVMPVVQSTLHTELFLQILIKIDEAMKYMDALTDRKIPRKERNQFARNLDTELNTLVNEVCLTEENLKEALIAYRKQHNQDPKEVKLKSEVIIPRPIETIRMDTKLG
jgi:hypothetical protein